MIVNKMITLAMNRDYVFQLTKGMIYDKVNESEGDEE